MAENTKGRCGRSQIRAHCALALAAVGVACAAGAAELPSIDSVESELKDLLPSWERSFTASVSGGYNDNVTLSHAAPEASPFVRFGIEAAASRLTLGGTQYSFFLTGEDTQYFDAGPVGHEDFVVGQAEVRRLFNEQWQGALTAEAIYLDQVVDLSISETNRSPLLVRGVTLIARPGVRRDFANNWSLNLDVPVLRQWYQESIDDFWEMGPTLTLSRGYAGKSEVSLTYALAYRHYDTEPALDAQGFAITNQTRAQFQNDVVLAWKHHWDDAQRWRTVLSAGFRNNLDNASGYFNFNRVAVSGSLRYRVKRWEASATARVSQYWFAEQTAGDSDQDKRERTDLALVLRAEMQLVKHLRVFAQYSHDRTISNLTLDEYSVNSTQGGIRVDF